MTTSPSRQKRTATIDTDALARWAFILGLILAILIALVADISEWAQWVMVLLGLVAGYLFITEEAEHHFVLLAIGLALSSQIIATLTAIGGIFTAVLNSLATFFAVMVVALVVRNIIAWITPQK